MPTTNSLSKTILFVTGAFVPNTCWNEWKRFFESNGYHSLAPAWPYRNNTAEDLRNPDQGSALAAIRLMTLIDYFETFTKQLPEPPILIGHSLGGTIIQLLLQRGLGSAGVAIHPFPATGTGGRNFYLAAKWWGIRTFCTPSRATYMIPFKKWRKDFVNARSCSEQKQTYYDYAIPESRSLLKDVMTKKLPIDPSAPHAPLLLTSGSSDRLSPSARVYRNYQRWASSDPSTAYMDFKGVDHLVFGHRGWIAEAELILSWLRVLELT